MTVNSDYSLVPHPNDQQEAPAPSSKWNGWCVKDWTQVDTGLALLQNIAFPIAATNYEPLQAHIFTYIFCLANVCELGILQSRIALRGRCKDWTQVITAFSTLHAAVFSFYISDALVKFDYSETLPVFGFYCITSSLILLILQARIQQLITPQVEPEEPPIEFDEFVV